MPKCRKQERILHKIEHLYTIDVGGKEIKQTPTLLDLPQGKVYGANELSRVEEDVSFVLRQASDKCMKEAIKLKRKNIGQKAQ
eukprot:4525775-Ditylum_brightwellii.AAC.1